MIVQSLLNQLLFPRYLEMKRGKVTYFRSGPEMGIQVHIMY